jgi:uncharacterized membrane protein YbhN (UPF0104 family)
MRFFNSRIFQAAFAVIMLGVFGFFLYHNREYLGKALTITPGLLALLIALDVTSKILSGLKLRVVTGVFGVKLCFNEWFGIASVTTFYNYFFSKSGTVIAATYLKKVKGYEYSKFMCMLLGDFLMVLASSGIIGSLACFYGSKLAIFKGAELVGSFFLAITLASLIAMLIPSSTRFTDKGIFKKANSILNGWEMLKKRPFTVFLLFILNAGVLAVFALRYYLLFRVFGTMVPMCVCLVVSPMSILVQITSVIPAAYGIREAVMGFVTKISNFGFVPGAVVSIIDRAVMMFVFFVLGPVYSYYLMKRGAKIEPGAEGEIYEMD